MESPLKVSALPRQDAELGSGVRQTQTKYRPDIDGLRAIAVLAVVCFHLGYPMCRGGFVGVDVFFVISGFLIGGILRAEIEGATFDLSAFYERRVRRILPALFIMLACCIACASIAYTPQELRGVVQSAFAALVFLANFQAYSADSYFSPDIATKPLLHVWSLAVEEQFYALFPVLLILLYRWCRRRVALVMCVLGGMSFVWSAELTIDAPAAAFYLPASRFWELLLGSILFVVPRAATATPVRADTITCLGLFLIARAIFGYDSHMLYPGVAALLPCMGAGLVIIGGVSARGFASQALAIAPMRFIGRISYSLYLWHWPVLVFYQALGAPLRAAGGAWHWPLVLLERPVQFELSGHERVLLLVISIGAATLSYAVVETPARRGFGTRPRKQVFAVAGLCAAALAIAAALVPLANSALLNLSGDVERLLAFADPVQKSPIQPAFCKIDPHHAAFDGGEARACLEPRPGKPNYLIIGDSHAAHLWYGLAQTRPEAHVLVATGPGCKPLRTESDGPAYCETLHHTVREYVDRYRYDALVLSARWRRPHLPALKALVSDLTARGQRVVVFGPTVEYDVDLPRLIVLAKLHRDPGLFRRHVITLTKALDAEMTAALAGTGADYVSVFRTYCAGEECAVQAKDGTPYQWDYGHLTRAGSTFLASQVAVLRGDGHVGKSSFGISAPTGVSEAVRR